MDLADADGHISRAFPNTVPGVKRLVVWLLKRYSPQETQVVAEPTSTYHQHLIVALASSGIAFTLVNPASAAYYARSQMRRSKTDKIDARMLARMGGRENLSPTPPPVQWREGLKALLRHRDRLRGEAGAWHSRLGAANKSPWITKEELASIRGMQRRALSEAAKTEAKLWELMKAHPGLMEQVRLLKTVKGVGDQTALAVTLELPLVEQTRSAKAWGAFAGLAPSIQQSGKSEYSLLSRTGSARIRKALYMPALVAIKHNPAIKVFAERLKANGKSNMVVIAAVMHKLLRICFGVLKSGRPFDLSMHPTAAVAAATAAVEIPLLLLPGPSPEVNTSNTLTQRRSPTQATALPVP